MAHIEMAKTFTVVLMKARKSLVVQWREKRVSWTKKSQNNGNIFFKSSYQWVSVITEANQTRQRTKKLFTWKGNVILVKVN